jgi:hypothetical protein
MDIQTLGKNKKVGIAKPMNWVFLACPHLLFPKYLAKIFGYMVLTS